MVFPGRRCPSETLSTAAHHPTTALILGNGGGPNYATTFISMYIYTTAFECLRFGYAAALTRAMYALTALVLLGQYAVARRWRLGFADAE